MTTVELDMRRMELIRDIMDTDSIEVLDKVKRAFKRAVKSVQTEAYGPVPGIPHTIEEVKADIAEFEREWDGYFRRSISSGAREHRREWSWKDPRRCSRSGHRRESWVPCR